MINAKEIICCFTHFPKTNNHCACSPKMQTKTNVESDFQNQILFCNSLGFAFAMLL